MKNKKLVAIPLVIAIALSIFGFVYAHWSDTLYIDGTVNMSSLTLAFSTDEEPLCEEYYFNPDPPPDRVLGEWEDKDVGSCAAWYDDLFTDAHSGKQGYETLVIQIDNAYPQYIVHTHFIAHNIGTMPLYLYGIDFTGEKKNSTGAVIYDLIADSWISLGDIYGDIYEDVDASGNVTLGDILVINFRIKNSQIPVQIEPCNDEKMEIDIDFKQEAEECHTYTLEFSLLAIQWNKLYEVYP